jgi:GR25 family glycosyltransferase involved in LPS biosynthesis
VPVAVRSILDGSVRPDRIVLYLASELEGKLPQELQSLIAAGLEVRFREDVGPHTKWFYAIQEFPDSCVIVIDDDQIYHPDLVRSLCKEHDRYPDKFISNFIIDSAFIDICASSCYRFYLPQSWSGYILPPNALTTLFHDDVLNKELFKQLTPFYDSVWLWAMAKLRLNTEPFKELTNPVFSVWQPLDKRSRRSDSLMKTVSKKTGIAEKSALVEIDSVCDHYADLRKKVTKPLKPVPKDRMVWPKLTLENTMFVSVGAYPQPQVTCRNLIETADKFGIPITWISYEEKWKNFNYHKLQLLRELCLEKQTSGIKYVFMFDSCDVAFTDKVETLLHKAAKIHEPGTLLFNAELNDNFYPYSDSLFDRTLVASGCHLNSGLIFGESATFIKVIDLARRLISELKRGTPRTGIAEHVYAKNVSTKIYDDDQFTYQLTSIYYPQYFRIDEDRSLFAWTYELEQPLDEYRNTAIVSGCVGQASVIHSSSTVKCQRDGLKKFSTWVNNNILDKPVKKELTLDDFEFVISTTDSPLSIERRKRIAQYLEAANISNYSFDEEPQYLISEINIMQPGHYGAGTHFANILKKAKNKNLIYVEDDAIFTSDFREQLNKHLSQLPPDWNIFVAGYRNIVDARIEYAADNVAAISEGFFYGAQCVVLKSGAWKDALVDYILSGKLWKHNEAFDTYLCTWCENNNVNLYLAAPSFVGQGDCVSIITGVHSPLEGFSFRTNEKINDNSFMSKNNLTFDDFVVVVTTTDSPTSKRRRKQITKLFANSGITNYVFDVEQEWKVSPYHIPPHYYGCARHLANVLQKYADKNVIIFEDNAIFEADFISVFNSHVSQLPNDWRMFFPGYLWTSFLRHNVPNTSLMRVSSFGGMQCVAVKVGAWRNTLIEDILNNSIYDLYGKNYTRHDVALLPWANKHSITAYFASESFVGYDNTSSVIAKEDQCIGKNNLTFEDFEIVISTTDSQLSVERRERMCAYFARAGITNYSFDEEPQQMTSPLEKVLPGYYGCARHWANILQKYDGKNVIIFEDDAVFNPDFVPFFNYYVAQLPSDCGMFFPGYCLEHFANTFPVDNTDLVTVDIFWGMQCVAVLAGKWREQLIKDILSSEIYFIDGNAFDGYDRAILLWNKKHNVGSYFANSSFVGQGDCMSIATNSFMSLWGIQKEARIIDNYVKENSLTFDDFEVVVSTTDSPHSLERRERIKQYFDKAGITSYSFDEEPLRVSSPINTVLPGHYGCGTHFANILNKYRNKNLIYVEDDAVFEPDFRDKLNQHLSNLPHNWDIFLAGYRNIFSKNLLPHGNNITVVDGHFCGTQCVVLRAGNYRDYLAAFILSGVVWKQAEYFDVAMCDWCRASAVNLYLAEESFVGQGACISIIDNVPRRLEGLPGANDILGLCDGYFGKKRLKHVSFKYLFDKYKRWTDKGHRHNYGPYYDFWLAEKTVKRILLLGCTQFGGGDILAFSDYYPEAQIVGVDFRVPTSTPNSSYLSRNNVSIEILDVYAIDAVNVIKEKYGSFDLIIDDVNHNLEANLKCFSLWNSLLTANGIFIVEDITPSYLSDLLKELRKHTNWKFEFINTWVTRNDPVLDDSIIVKGIRLQP